MSRKIKIIVQKTNLKLGKKNSIIEVAQGYALNYLIPNGLAKIASTGELKHIKMLQKVEKFKLEDEEKKAFTLQENLEKIKKINVNKKIGDTKQIFGSISEKEMIIQISNYTGIILDKKQFNLPAVKTTGAYQIKIELSNKKYANLKLQILPDNIKKIV